MNLPYLPTRLGLALSASALLGLSSGLAADWAGQTIKTDFLFPDTGTVFESGPNSVVGPGLEIPTIAFETFSINFTPTQIIVTSLGEVNFGQPPFSGFHFFDVFATAPNLVGVSLNGASTITPTDLFGDTDNIWVNLSGQSLAGEQSAIIDLHFQQQVPEASTFAAALILVPAVGMWWRRRSRA